MDCTVQKFLPISSKNYCQTHSILHADMKYGVAEYESPYIIEIDLVHLILFLSELDNFITERMTLIPLKELAQTGQAFLIFHIHV